MSKIALIRAKALKVGAKALKVREKQMKFFSVWEFYGRFSFLCPTRHIERILCDLFFRVVLTLSTCDTPAKNLFYKWTKISSLKINIFDINHISLICLEIFILRFTEPLQSYCCPVQKNLPRRAELARQVSRYL